MNKKNLASLLVFVGIVFIVVVGFVVVKSSTESGGTFYATIENISEYNGITTVLVKSLQENNSYSGEYDFSIKDSTKLIHNNETISITDLKVGQKILITFTGEILERYPAGISNVTKVEIID